ncbi:MAG: hypothetical protein R3C01_12260 [Planctomycetaceae bacterium]
MIFIPIPDKIGDADVPVFCPSCGGMFSLDGLSHAEKQTLIDLKRYHDESIEYRYYTVIAGIVEQFPATQHPLLVNKLPPNRTGSTDDDLVDMAIDEHLGMREYLTNHGFRFDKRWHFVRKFQDRSLPSPLTPKIRCLKCDDQYLVLTDDYYYTLGM